MQIDKKMRNKKRKNSIRKRVVGTLERPRLSVKFSGKHIYAQCVNDENGTTLFFLSTLAEEVRDQRLTANTSGAAVFGKIFGDKTIAAGIKNVVFDRNGRKYHGCVKYFADSAREAGLSF